MASIKRASDGPLEWRRVKVVRELFDQDSIDHQWEELERLRAAELELNDLRSSLAGAEVECLSAEVAVKAGLERGRPRIDAGIAAEVMTALILARGGREATHPAVPDTYERSQLEVGVGALRDWLEAGRKNSEEESGRRRLEVTVRLILLALVMGVVWAAVDLHVAFLLLLPPIVVPYTMLMRSGDDSKWRRMGAQRNFSKTKLEVPLAWDEPAVQARHDELAGIIARHRTPKGADDHHEHTKDATGAQARLVELLEEHRIAGGSTGWDISPDVEAWLRTLRAAYVAEGARDQIKASLAQVERIAGDARESLFRFLAKRGAAPGGGAADSAMLEAGLNRVAGRL